MRQIPGWQEEGLPPGVVPRPHMCPCSRPIAVTLPGTALSSCIRVHSCPVTHQAHRAHVTQDCSEPRNLRGERKGCPQPAPSSHCSQAFARRVPSQKEISRAAGQPRALEENERRNPLPPPPPILTKMRSRWRLALARRTKCQPQGNK